MKKSWLIIVLIVLIVFVACDKTDEDIPFQYDYEALTPISQGEVIKHTYYTLAYSEENEQAVWVYYTLTEENINGPQDRTEDFRSDTLVSTGSATLDDYKYSGYDRGHLCPAGDMTQNKTAMSETFYLSNISPQLAGFNRYIWSDLEIQVRKWTGDYQMLYIVTGPIFKDNIGVIGKNKVTVPGYFYKVIFDGHNKMTGFILPNASSSKSLDQFQVTVDEVEKQTGIDFFPGLNDDLEKQLESTIGEFTF